MSYWSVGEAQWFIHLGTLKGLNKIPEALRGTRRMS